MKKVYKYFAFAGLVIGILLGIFAPEFSTTSVVAGIGTWYINILKILIGPVVFCSIATSILNHKKGEGKMIWQTILLFIIMFVSTFLLTSLVVTIAKPGLDFVNQNPGETPKEADFSVLSILKNLLPSSAKSFFMGGSIFFIIILSIVISLIFTITPLKKLYYTVIKFVKFYLDFLLKIVLYLTPIAVIALVANMIATYGQTMLGAGLIYIVMAYVCSFIALIVIMILPACVIGKINPFKYIARLSKVWLITLSTCSSVATLPHTIKVCNEDFKINKKVTDIVVPLGCTIHMCGGAVSFALLGLFVAQMNNIVVTVPLYLLMLLSATLINMAAPGIPGGGVVIGLSYLSLLGLPVNGFYGFYAGIYKFLDMSYTTLNVTGDVTANIIIDQLNK